MTLIVQCKGLAKRIRSFFVINLDFYFFNDNVFSFDKKNILPMFKIISDEDDSQRNNFAIIDTAASASGTNKKKDK